MERDLKRQKTLSIVGNTVIMACIVEHLPVISVMALVRVFPRLREQRVVTGAKLIDRVYRELQQKMRPEFFNREWGYTGSLVMEVLLGETFTNGKRDVDAITDRPAPTGFEPVTAVNKNAYANTYQIGDDKIDLIDNQPGVVQTFDLDCCKLYVAPNKLKVYFPVDLLTKKTTVNGDIFAKRLHPNREKVDWAAHFKMRLQKYKERGFEITVKYEMNDAINMLLKHHKSLFYCGIPLYAGAHTLHKFTTYNQAFKKWLTDRPPPGLY